MEEEIYPEPTPLLLAAKNLSTLHELLAEPISQLILVFQPDAPLLKQKLQSSLQKHPLLEQKYWSTRTPPFEPGIPPTPILETLFTVSPRKCLHADINMPPYTLMQPDS